MATPESRICTIPNLISFLRLLVVPWFWWLVLSRRSFLVAGIVLLVIGATDWVDGYLARRLDQVTELGKLLDPTADRLMIASSVFTGLITSVVPLVIGVLILLREALIAIGTVMMLKVTGERPVVREKGKIGTFVLYGAIPSFFLHSAGVTEPFFWGLGWGFACAGLLLYYWVAIEYLGDIRRLTR